jgi:head-tail adaptor
MMRDPGQMRERITIEVPTTVQDATGGHSTTWAPIAHGGGTLWARKLTEKAVEAFSGSRLLGKVEAAYAIRYWPGHGLGALHRFVHQGRVYSMVDVVESEHRQELVLLGTAGANRG